MSGLDVAMFVVAAVFVTIFLIADTAKRRSDDFVPIAAAVLIALLVLVFANFVLEALR